MKTNQRILTGVVVLLFLLCLISVLPVHGEAKIYDTVVRLHVLANSDSEEDQALKLAVRDACLARARAGGLYLWRGAVPHAAGDAGVPGSF